MSWNIGAGGDLVRAWAESFDVDKGDANTIGKYFEPGTLIPFKAVIV